MRVAERVLAVTALVGGRPVGSGATPICLAGASVPLSPNLGLSRAFSGPRFATTVVKVRSGTELSTPASIADGTL
jgi:hypothetical protein